MHRVGKRLRHANIGGLSAAMFLAVATGLPGGANAQEPRAIQEVPDLDELGHSDSLRLIYVPPSVGRPVRATGGATRDSSLQRIFAGATGSTSLQRIFAFTPDHVGTTLTAQPVLYWYLDKKTDHQIDFALFRPDSGNSIAETTLGKKHEPGIHRVALADLGITLKPGIEYEWTIIVISDEKKRSKVLVATGWIELVVPSDELKAELAAADPEDRQFVLAKAGIWYDALDEISQQIDTSPDTMYLYAQFEALLKQVGFEPGHRFVFEPGSRAYDANAAATR